MPGGLLYICAIDPGLGSPEGAGSPDLEFAWD